MAFVFLNNQTLNSYAARLSGHISQSKNSIGELICLKISLKFSSLDVITDQTKNVILSYAIRQRSKSDT